MLPRLRIRGRARLRVRPIHEVYKAGVEQQGRADIAKVSDTVIYSCSLL